MKRLSPLAAALRERLEAHSSGPAVIITGSNVEYAEREATPSSSAFTVMSEWDASQPWLEAAALASVEAGVLGQRTGPNQRLVWRVPPSFDEEMSHETQGLRCRIRCRGWWISV